MRRSIGAAMPLAMLMLLGVASVALAKEGMVELDAALPADAPGTSVDVGFVVTMPGPEGQDRLAGANAFVRVRGASGPAVVAWATERPAASGHYVVSFVVPAGGIQMIDIGLADPDCRTMSCANHGFMLELSDQRSGVTPAAPAARASTPVASQPSVPVGVLVLAGCGLAALALALAVGRGLLPQRRRARPTI